MNGFGALLEYPLVEVAENLQIPDEVVTEIEGEVRQKKGQIEIILMSDLMNVDFDGKAVNRVWQNIKQKLK